MFSIVKITVLILNRTFANVQVDTGIPFETEYIEIQAIYNL